MRSLFLLGALLFTGPALASPLDDIQGKWTTGLMTDSEGYIQYRQIYDFRGTDCSIKIDLLVNHPIGQAGERMVWGCRFTVIGPSASVPGAWEVDVEILKHTLTPLHPASVEDYNLKKMCGFDDWRLGGPKDVSNLDCDGAFTETGTIHDLVKIIPNESVQFGLGGDDDPLGSPRPTELDPDNIVPRNGPGGPIDPHPTEDMVKGYYQVTGFKANNAGCDEGGLGASSAPFSHYQMIANRDIIPMMGGWSFESCNSEAECRAKADELTFMADFAIGDQVDESHYKGLGRSLNWAGQCYGKAVQTVTEREGDGSLHMVSRFLSGVVQGITNSDDCNLENPLVDAQLPLFQCDKLLDLRGRRL